MGVVEAIPGSRGMSGSDVTRAIAYVPDLHDAPLPDAHCRAHGISGLRATPVRATICREELLFELELEAVSDPSCAPAPAGDAAPSSA